VDGHVRSSAQRSVWWACGEQAIEGKGRLEPCRPLLCSSKGDAQAPSEHPTRERAGPIQLTCASAARTGPVRARRAVWERDWSAAAPIGGAAGARRLADGGLRALDSLGGAEVCAAVIVDHIGATSALRSRQVPGTGAPHAVASVRPTPCPATNGSPVQTPAKHEPLGHRVPLASGVGALQVPLAGSQVRGAWQLVDGHVTLPAAQRSVWREGGQQAWRANQRTVDGGGVRGEAARQLSDRPWHRRSRPWVHAELGAAASPSRVSSQRCQPSPHPCRRLPSTSRWRTGCRWPVA
jgi:hypothetical protein